MFKVGVYNIAYKFRKNWFFIYIENVIHNKASCESKYTSKQNSRVSVIYNINYENSENMVYKIFIKIYIVFELEHIFE